MKNQFSIQYEYLTCDNCHSHNISLCKSDIKDIAISLMKLVYGKIKKLTFFNGNKIITEIINRDTFAFRIDDEEITLTQNNVELILSFLLDATEEYMPYDHIDLELSAGDKTVDVCIKIDHK